VHRLARHVCGVVAGEEHGDPRDVLRLRHVSERHRARHHRELVFGIAVAGLRGVGETRRDRVHADAVRGELERHRARHGDDAALARRVVDAPHGAADRLRRHVDDRASATRGDHRARGGLRAEEPALEVHVKHEVPVSLAHLEKRHARIDPRVVDQHVEPAELADDLRHHCVDAGRSCDVGLHEHGTASGSADFLDDLLGRVAIIQIVHADVGALAGERQRDRPTNTLLGSGHQRHLATEPHRRLLDASFVRSRRMC
jgi:hypothetical protein